MRTTSGGAERAQSVLNGLRALPASVGSGDWVLVHDAARPCLRPDDLSRLVELGIRHPVGALLAQPMSDTVKRADGLGQVEATVARGNLWRALTPQLFRRGELIAALDAMLSIGSLPTDEANALEVAGEKSFVGRGFCEIISKSPQPCRILAAAILESRKQSVS